MTLAEHLAAGYDYFVRARMRPWTPTVFGAELKADAALMAEAKAKLAECDATLRAGRKCHITEIQQRTIREGLSKSAA